ncbi:MAG: hypothetical protein KC561_13485, partial [Myxococcales bacterium]|nr:hypothetical protein [Myxococcales bacterium]
EDFYTIDLLAGERIVANVLFTDSIGDLDVRLHLGPYNSSDYYTSGTSSSDNETVAYTATTDKTVYIRVFGYRGAQNEYDIEFQHVIPYDCQADGFDNGTPETALDAVNHQGMTICSGENDFYAVDLLDGQTITANVFFEDAIGDIELKLYTGSEYDASSPEESSTSTSDNESVSYTADGNEHVLIRVYGYSNNENEYDIEFLISDPE